VEELSIRVSVETAEAAAAFVILTTSIRDTRTEAERLGAVLDGLPAKVGALGSNSGQAAPQLGQLGTNTGQAAQNTQNLNVQVNQFNTQANQFNSNVTNITNSTGALRGRTTGMAGEIEGLIKSYMGFRAVIEVFETLLEKLADVKKAQDELASGAMTFENKLDVVMRNIGVGYGPQAQVQATKIVSEIQESSKASIGTVMSAITAASSSLIDVKTAGGKAFTAELAAYAQRNSMDDEATKQFAKMLVDQGVTDVPGLQAEEARQDATFKNVGTGSFSEFIRGEIRGTQSVMTKGADRDSATAFYAAASHVTTDMRAAAQMSEQVYKLASGKTPKSIKMMAEEGQRLGLVGGQVSDDQVSDAIAAGATPEAATIRQAQAGYERRLREDVAQEDVYRARKAPKGQTPAQERAEREKHSALLASRQAQLEKLHATIEAATAKLKEHLQLGGAEEQVKAMSIQDRALKLLIPIAIAAEGDIEATNRLQSEAPGMVGPAAMAILGNKNIQKVYQKTMADRKAATGSQAAAETAAHQQQNNAMLVDAQAKAELTKAAASDSGNAYNVIKDVGVEAEYSKRVASGKYLKPTGTIDDITNSKTRRMAEVKGELMDKDLYEIIIDPSVPSDLKQQAIDIAKNLWDERRSVLNAVPSSAAQTMQNFGESVGNLQARIRQQKTMQPIIDANRAAASQTPPAGAAQGGSLGPRSDAGGTHYHGDITTVTIGQLITHDDEVEDSEGRWGRHHG
jgi:hypothetical protein